MRERLVATTSQVALHLTKVGLTSKLQQWSKLRLRRRNPVESALVSGEMPGWRAADSGTQTIRLIFDHPQMIKRIALVFEEPKTERTQQFLLRWSADGGRSFREIVRQQWNFSPPNTSRENEEYDIQFSDVTVLELVIVPDISRGTARAWLKSLRLS